MSKLSVLSGENLVLRCTIFVCSIVIVASGDLHSVAMWHAFHCQGDLALSPGDAPVACCECVPSVCELVVYFSIVRYASFLPHAQCFSLLLTIYSTTGSWENKTLKTFLKLFLKRTLSICILCIVNLPYSHMYTLNPTALNITYGKKNSDEASTIVEERKTPP